jgi:hypothetical protein
VRRGAQPEPEERLHAWMEPRPDEHGVGVDPRAAVQLDPVQPAVGVGEDTRRRGGDAHVDASGGEGVEVGFVDLDPVGDQYGQAVGQLAQQRDDVQAHRMGDKLDQPLVAHLVAVAERAMDHRPTPMRGQPLNVGQLVDQTGRDDDPAGHDAVSGGELHDEAPVVPPHPQGSAGQHLAPVASYFRSARGEQLRRVGAITAEETVHVRSRRVTRLTGVDHDHRPALTA